MPSTPDAPVPARPVTTPLPHNGRATTTRPGRLLPPSDPVAHPRRRWWKVRRAGAVLLAIIVAGVGAWVTGLLDELSVTSPSRAASSPTVKVVEEQGYSFEVPNFWRTESIDGTELDHAFSVLDQSVVAITATRVPSSVDPADPAVRAFLFDTVSRGFQLQLGGITPTSTVPFSVDGADGQQVVITATGADGAPTDASQTVLIHGRRVVTTTIITHGLLADSGKTQREFQALLESIRFR